jgi:serine/threonine-protein kinase
MDRIRGHALLGDFERARDLLDADLFLDDARMGNGVLRSRLATWSPVIADTLDKVVIPDAFQPNTPWAFAAAMKIVFVSSDLDAYLPLFEQLPNQIGSTRRAKTLFHQIITEFAVHFGRTERGLEGLEDAVNDGLFDVSWAERCPVLNPIRNEPRFQAALATLRERGAEVLRELDG